MFCSGTFGSVGVAPGVAVVYYTTTMTHETDTTGESKMTTDLDELRAELRHAERVYIEAGNGQYSDEVYIAAACRVQELEDAIAKAEQERA